MSILDVKRTQADFLKKKGKSSMCTLRKYDLPVEIVHYRLDDCIC